METKIIKFKTLCFIALVPFINILLILLLCMVNFTKVTRDALLVLVFFVLPFVLLSVGLVGILSLVFPPEGSLVLTSPITEILGIVIFYIFSTSMSFVAIFVQRLNFKFLLKSHFQEFINGVPLKPRQEEME